MADQVLLSSLNDGKHVLRARCTRIGECWHTWEIDIGEMIHTLGDIPFADLRRHLRCPNCNAPVTITLKRAK